ncbi:MAG: hypothetical protein KJ077_36640 [Anaerolineae bacterium]|nr:hypothetical protein [Anaerolineae bacterium]
MSTPSTVTQPAIFDLVIASKKVGCHCTPNPDAPIAWIKRAGFPRRPPFSQNISLTNPEVQAFLKGYELVETEPLVNLVVRRYRRIPTQDAPAQIAPSQKIQAESNLNKPRCDAYYRSPSSNSLTLIRCRKIARYQLTLQSGGEPYTVNRCQSCRDELMTKMANGTTFEILDEVVIETAKIETIYPRPE